MHIETYAAGVATLRHEGAGMASNLDGWAYARGPDGSPDPTLLVTVPMVGQGDGQHYRSVFPLYGDGEAQLAHLLYRARREHGGDVAAAHAALLALLAAAGQPDRVAAALARVAPGAT